MNDFLRGLIGWTSLALGFVSSGLLRLRILAFTLNQKRLKRKYGINRETPVVSYDPTLIQTARKNIQFAQTSGSTGEPKQIPYTKRRLFSLKLTFSDMFVRACYAFRIRRTSLYVFSSFERDASLTSLLLDENGLPNYLSTLQAPYRVQHHPAIQALVSRYGAAAVRLWLLTISNPGVLYSTNPSTISTFLDELASDWRRSAKLIEDWCDHRKAFDSDVHRIARRLHSRGCEQRLKQIATSNAPLPLSVFAPAVEAYICWTGGYVKPFLDRLATHLPTSHYCLIPMYSMSTETIETLPRFRGEDVAFFPMASGVLYEFIEETAVNYPDNLLNAQQLESGKLYAMVVSDGYGLRRYQTDDLFLCRRKVNGLRDLAFERRRSLGYSFTGEKLTAEQLGSVFEQLRAQYPAIIQDRLLTCVPSQPEQAVPYYRVLLVGDRGVQSSHELLAIRCDELLSQINCEYKSKRASGRLGPVTCVDVGIEEFPEGFKFLPLIFPQRRKGTKTESGFES